MPPGTAADEWDTRTVLNQLGRMLDRGTVQVSPLLSDTATAEKFVDHRRERATGSRHEVHVLPCADGDSGGRDDRHLGGREPQAVDHLAREVRQLVVRVSENW